VAPAFDAFVRHPEEHFASEERLMDRYGFPARECHADEHERVMSSVREVRALVAAGDARVGRELAQALADWFPGHSDYMDSAVATWVAKKTVGGAPVVLRRTKEASGGASPNHRPGSMRATVPQDREMSAGASPA
jgi:hemerythrin